MSSATTTRTLPDSYTVPLKLFPDSQVLVSCGTDSFYSKQGLGLKIGAPQPTAVPFPYKHYDITKLINTPTGVAVIVAKCHKDKKHYLFAAGRSIGNAIPQSGYFEKIDLSFLPEPSVRLVSVGNNCIVIQTEDYKVWIAGHSSYCKMVHTTKNFTQYQNCPFHREPGIPLKQIDVSNSCVCFVAEDGRMWVQGLWTLDDQTFRTPTLVTDASNWKFGKVLGMHFGLLISSTGLYILGEGTCLGSHEGKRVLPRVNPFDVVSVGTCVDNYSLVLSDGRVILHKTCSDNMETTKLDHEFVTMNHPTNPPLPLYDQFVKTAMSNTGDLLLLSREGNLYGFASRSPAFLGTGNTDALVKFQPPAGHKDKVVLDICANSNAMNTLLGMYKNMKVLFLGKKAAPLYNDVIIQYM